MAITIRNNVFETNSSSTHSVTIKSTNKWDNILPNSDNIIIIYGDDFGWEWEKYNDAYTKAKYCAVYFKHDDTKLEELKEIISDYTNADDVIFYVDDSYIDHQSSDILDDLTMEEIKDFIFCLDSWLYLGNDNSDNSNFYE